MSNKLNNMKNEYEEAVKKIEEIDNKLKKISNECEARFKKGIQNTHQQAQEICDKMQILHNEQGPFNARRNELIHKIRIREEALDLLIELGLVNENLKQPSIFDKIKSLI